MKYIVEVAGSIVIDDHLGRLKAESDRLKAESNWLKAENYWLKQLAETMDETLSETMDETMDETLDETPVQWVFMQSCDARDHGYEMYRKSLIL